MTVYVLTGRPPMTSTSYVLGVYTTIERLREDREEFKCHGYDKLDSTEMSLD